MKKFISIISLFAVVVTCSSKQQKESSDESEIAVVHNTLTEQEIEQGWKLLFDGESTNGWKGYRKDKPGTAWKVEDGTLHLDVSQKEGKAIIGGGDIITMDEYENYELSLDWKIQPCGNSGVIFNVVEDEQFSHTYDTGPEMQVLDNECHPDAKIIKHRAGDLYDMISCSQETVKPGGEWNQARLISDHGNVTFWLNGVQTVSFVMHTPEWELMVAGSKFKDMPHFGKSKKGHIALQEHENEVWYRNIKIKVIKE